MMSVVMPIPVLRAQFFYDAEKFFARVAAVHEFQDAVAAALDGKCALSQSFGRRA
jgi:hypothetical protein